MTGEADPVRTEAASGNDVEEGPVLKMLRRWLRPADKARPSYRAPEGQRLYAIGDLHGRADLLAKLMALIVADLQPAPARGALMILLGDYVDRGPDSRGVLELLAQGGLPTPIVALRGNHETMLLDFLAEPDTAANWRRFGGLETLHSYGLDIGNVQAGRGYREAAEKFASALPAAHLDFLKSTLPCFSAGDYYFCHAGIRPDLPLAAQKEEDLLWMREPFLSSRADFGKLVVHGHTPVAAPDIRRNRINIDTGAYLSGRLTCLVLEAQERRFLFADQEELPRRA
jgi:serine/threonine protein phosphatase 1